MKIKSWWTDRQQSVFDAAKAKLESQPWFRGICLDNFPEDRECENFNTAVAAVCFETAMWDDPGFMEETKRLAESVKLK